MRRAGTQALRIALVLVLAAVGAGGCRQRDDAARETGSLEPMRQQEIETGRKACQAYVDQVCRCAEKKPNLAGECEMARARPEAFEMNVRAGMAEGDQTLKDRRDLIANSRKIMRGCIEDSAGLVKQGCPAQPAPPPGPAPTR